MKAEVEIFKTDQIVLKETAEQIQKDFASCGIEIFFSGKEIFPYESLLNQVEHHIHHLISHHLIQLQTLLYRVDIPEGTYFKLKKHANSFPNELSRLILEREFMKVVTRHLYKPGTK